MTLIKVILRVFSSGCQMIFLRIVPILFLSVQECRVLLYICGNLLQILGWSIMMSFVQSRRLKTFSVMSSFVNVISKIKFVLPGNVTLVSLRCCNKSWFSLLKINRENARCRGALCVKGSFKWHVLFDAEPNSWSFSLTKMHCSFKGG